MARKQREVVQSKDIRGLKYFDQLTPLLAPLLERLHEEGCARDRAGNRVLHYDQYAMLICYGPNCGRIFDRIVTVEILGSFAGC